MSYKIEDDLEFYNMLYSELKKRKNLKKNLNVV